MAVAADELFVFAGAGVSVSRPAGLPVFDWLRDEILGQLKLGRYVQGRDGTDARLATVASGLVPEPFMPELSRAGIDVRSWLSAVLSGGRPNAAHHALAQLARAGAPGVDGQLRHADRAGVWTGWSASRPPAGSPAIPTAIPPSWPRLPGSAAAASPASGTTPAAAPSPPNPSVTTTPSSPAAAAATWRAPGPCPSGRPPPGTRFRPPLLTLAWHPYRPHAVSPRARDDRCEPGRENREPAHRRPLPRAHCPALAR
jgi:hypothetical protein